MTRILLYIAGVLLAVAGIAFGWQTRSLGKATERAVAAEAQAGEYQRSLQSSEALLAALRKSAAAERDVLEKRAKSQAAALAKAKKEVHDLEEALKANRDWADQPIPPDVAGVLNQQADRP